MKAWSIMLCVFVAFAVITAHAGKPGRGGRQHPAAENKPAATPPPAIINPADPPSANLTRFIGAYMGALADLSAASQQATVVYRTDLSLMRAAIQAQGSAAAPPKRSTYEAALRVCDLLTAAIDEHDKNASSLASSQQVAGAQDIKDVRISTVRARHGYGRATRANNAKEMAENNQPSDKDAFVNSALLNAWTSRLTQLRQQIDTAYAQELSIEQQNAGANTPVAPAVVNSPAPSPR
jgi:hypothetical protein